MVFINCTNCVYHVVISTCGKETMLAMCIAKAMCCAATTRLDDPLQNFKLVVTVTPYSRGSFGSLRGTKDRGILSNISSLYCSYIVNTYYIVLTLHATTNYVA